MKGLGLIKRAVVIATLSAFGLPRAEAIEIFAGPNPAAHMNDSLLTQVRGGGGRGGGRLADRGGCALGQPAQVAVIGIGEPVAEVKEGRLAGIAVHGGRARRRRP